jgi:hypothetical protein
MEINPFSTQRSRGRFVYSMEMGIPSSECGVMERTELQKRLEQLDLQVWDVTQEVARNQKVITQLDAVGMDTNDAQLLLSRLENLLIVLLQEREKLRAKLDGSSQGPPPSGHS